jgi:ParB/RepB/Spo0J family partition protein
MSEEEFQDLVDSMKRVGVDGVDPIHVRKVGDKYFIVDGHHRYRAAQKLGWDKIRAWIHEKMDESEARVFNYMKNRLRGRLDPFKEAELFKWEMDRGLSDEEVAKKYGLKYRQRVWEKLSLLKIAPEVREFVRTSGQTQPSHLSVIAKLEKPELQMKLAKEIHEQKLSVREAERRAAALEFEAKAVKPVVEEKPPKEPEVETRVYEPTEPFPERLHPEKSKMELEVFKELVRLGYHVLTDVEFPILVVKPDIYFPEQNASVFIDGAEVHKGREERDAANRELLKKRYNQRVLSVKYDRYSDERRDRIVKEIVDFLESS